ncbi:hypothetical protein GV794_16830 [Nocardia cyriacigeorgica]|uniref:Uncharacterized protein n=1 Tax=Nocardia cyriacigeorgica TaxID=135487 RepID=A0A6P1D6V7_9NOCA|nr:hypothetical protein [Nocardia cyriacigeorgica]NEW38604.1 hypothetical protein [Nocardia cyriacigeorgica]NEW45309.1 hypothetical protein [Nocardia cyriacigeorgica]NEW57309.1 hypothetical protein [Nocardia cyriacigeorgica]
MVARYGERNVLLVLGALRACWPLRLTFVGPGIGGLLVVMVTEFGLILTMGLFNPIFATYRLRNAESGVLARVLAAWSITSTATIAAMTAMWVYSQPRPSRAVPSPPPPRALRPCC